MLYIVLLKKTWDPGDYEEHEQEAGSLVKVSEPLDQASPGPVTYTNKFPLNVKFSSFLKI